MNPSPFFTDRSIDAIVTKKSILCVGLDPQLDLMPPQLIAWARTTYGDTFEAVGRLFFRFNRMVIGAVATSAVWVKPQIAFYEAYGQWGLWAFEQTVAYARSLGLLVITDGKRGDGGDTARAYAQGHVGEIPWWPAGDEPQTIASPIRVDALTVHGYIADDCVTRFVKEMMVNGTCCFVVTKTSFRPNSAVEQLRTVNDLQVWEELAWMVGRWGDGTAGVCGWQNLGVVMGATYPEDTRRMRKILPRAWFLVPGYGAQGGGADDAVIGADEDGFGITVNSSRGIIYAYRADTHKALMDRPDECARLAAMHAVDELNLALRRAGKGRAFLNT